MEQLPWHGREFAIPATTTDWLVLIALLGVTVGALWRAADLPTALLGGALGFLGRAIDHHLYIPAAVALVATLALLSGRRVRRPRPGLRVLRETALLGAGYALYEQGRAAGGADAAAAEANARGLLAFEARLHLAFEPALQRALLDQMDLLRWFNGVYSYAYLPFVLGAVLWLYVVDDGTYRQLRTALGISALLAVITLVRFPVAPPRLLTESGMVDTHALLGRRRGFVNEYAAMPSFHVGWTVACGLALWRSLPGRVRWFWGIAPAALMTATVMVTGNHYWIDGVVGILFVVGPLLLLPRLAEAASAARALACRSVAGVRAVGARPIAWTGVGAVALLLGYLLAREAVDPGFTHYWGYQVAQIAVTIATLVALEGHFAAEGGLSWLTYTVVALATWADTFGTAGHMYDRYSGYDKVVHFGGGLAITAAAADLLCASRRKRGLPLRLPQTLGVAVGLAMTLNVGWEVYEYLGDRVFSTGRHAGWQDTTYDLISDTVGALVAVQLLRIIEPRRFATPPAPAPGAVPIPLGARLRRATLWCGIVAPPLVAAWTLVAAARREGYSHVGDTVSDLGAQGAPHAVVMQVGLVGFGLAAALFGVGFGALLPARGRAVSACLGGFGGAVALAGVFQDYPAAGGRNLEGYLHNALSLAAIVALLGAMCMVTAIAAGDAAWSPLLWPGFGCTGIVLLSSLAWIWGPDDVEGLIERALYAAAALWLFLAARAALRLAALPDAQPAPQLQPARAEVPLPRLPG